MNETIFGIRKNARVEVIIDGTNLYTTTRALEFDVDFKKLRTLLSVDQDVRKRFYHQRAIFDSSGHIENAQIAKLHDFLRFNGYQLLIGEAREYNRQVDVPIACNIIESAKRVDEIIVFASSDELLPAIHMAQDTGARVTVVAGAETAGGLLRGDADWFVDLAEIKNSILRVHENPRSEHPRVQENPHHIFTPRSANAAATVVEDRREGALGNRARVSRVRL